jgi:2-pyrone-4,6-dicarboxylate lactonase
VHFDRSLIDELAPALMRSSVPVVIDHMGRVMASEGLDQPAFSALCRLLDDQRFWVKVSGGDRVSGIGAPYRDAAPFARMLVERFGDRTLWGTDWPHPNTVSPPDDGLLVDLLADIVMTSHEMKALLVDNPQRLYHFPVSYVRSSTEGALMR